MSHDADANSTDDQIRLEEHLVAYLDGELDDEDVRRVEELLASDAKVRQTLEKLEGTWDLLDSLEQAHVDEVFTQSTLEMVAVAAAEDVQSQQAQAPRLRLRRWWIAGGSTLCAVGAGFLAVLLFWPDPNRELLQDLPVLERLDHYRQIDDIRFVEMLLDNEKELFSEEARDES
ncbi:MAG: hypothetical protein ABIK89_21550 [Planctomycetota bacterium]